MNLMNILGDKPLYRSVTMWGLAVFVGVTAAFDEVCARELLSQSACDTGVYWAEKIGTVLGAIGIRRKLA